MTHASIGFDATIRLGSTVPAYDSCISAILRRGRLDHTAAATRPRRLGPFRVPGPNDVWQMDFKGEFALVNGNMCYPLTILDDHSRYSLGIRACGDQQQATVQGHLTDIFRRYGLPRKMLMVNESRRGSWRTLPVVYAPADRLAAAAGRACLARPSLPPANPGQGRAVSPDAQAGGDQPLDALEGSDPRIIRWVKTAQRGYDSFRVAPEALAKMFSCRPPIDRGVRSRKFFRRSNTRRTLRCERSTRWVSSRSRDGCGRSARRSAASRSVCGQRRRMVFGKFIIRVIKSLISTYELK